MNIEGHRRVPDGRPPIPRNRAGYRRAPSALPRRVMGACVALVVLLLAGSAAPTGAGSWALDLQQASVPTTHPAGPQPLPADVRPALAKAARDREAIAANGCTLSELEVQPRSCWFGDKAAATTVALVGDSHAAQWFPALERIAQARGWRLITFTKVSCRFVDLRIYSRTLKREYTECERWRAIVVKRLVALAPALVIVGSSGGMAPMVAGDSDPRRQGQAMARLLRPVKSPIALMVDTPWWTVDVPTCIAQHQQDVRACELARPVALTWQHGIAERTAAALISAKLVDVTPAICPFDPCPVVLDKMIIYRDAFHLTATFAASLAPRIEALLPLPPG